MFAGFCGHANKNHIYTVLTVTTSPLRANIMLMCSSGHRLIWLGGCDIDLQ